VSTTWHFVKISVFVNLQQGLQTFLPEGHIGYYTLVRGLGFSRKVIASGYVKFFQINKWNIIFSLLTKCFAGRMKWIRGPDFARRSYSLETLVYRMPTITMHKTKDMLIVRVDAIFLAVIAMNEMKIYWKTHSPISYVAYPNYDTCTGFDTLRLIFRSTAPRHKSTLYCWPCHSRWWFLSM